MDKPWSELYVIPARTYPIGPGKWQSASHSKLNTPEIEMVCFECDRVNLRFGGDRGNRVGFTGIGLRELSAFCLELADQLEGK